MGGLVDAGMATDVSAHRLECGDHSEQELLFHRLGHRSGAQLVAAPWLHLVSRDLAYSFDSLPV